MKYKVLVLVHKDLIPPDSIDKLDPSHEFLPYITEFDVVSNLKKLKYEVEVLGVYSDLKVIREKIDEFNPHVIFNLLEEFDGDVLLDQNVVSYLELLRVKYTGSNPRGLMLARDKALSKKILSFHRILTPKFKVFRFGKKVKITKSFNLNFPLIVKCLSEEASLGIAQASVVNSVEKMIERIEFLHTKYEVDALVEQFIEGREFYVGSLGNNRVQVLPAWELKFEKVKEPEKEIYSEKAKWSEKYRQRKGIISKKADIDQELEEILAKICKKAYKALYLTGYARFDFRVTESNEIYLLEANPNPNISESDEFAVSAKHSGISYRDLLKKIIKLALKK